ncbi:MAG: hypothetical protein ACE361_16885 [Aureliella sp.]
MDTRLQIRLHRVASRLRSLKMGWGLAAVWAIASAIGYALLVGKQSGYVTWPNLHWGWGISAALAGLLAAILIIRRSRDLVDVAKRLEQHFPGLDNSLLTATQQRPSDGKFSFLQRNVIGQAIRHDVTNHWPTVVSGSSVACAWLTNISLFVLAVFVGFTLWRTPVGSLPESLIEAPSNAVMAASVRPPVIEPGNTEIEKGSSVIVTAIFEGRLPEEVWLVKTSLTGENSKIMMRQSLEDPIFAAYLYDVQQPTEYLVEYDDASTDSYRIDVFEYPELVRSDALLNFPSYMDRESKTVLDTRRVTAVEGTQLAWHLHVNKPDLVVRIAEDGAEPGAEQILESTVENPLLFEAEFLLTESKEWNIELVDSDGRANPNEYTLRAKVLPNKESTIRLTAGGDQQVSPLEEFEIQAELTDDFAIHRAGIGFQHAAGELIELDATDNLTSKGRKKILAETIDFEALGARPMEFVSYYVWAEDKDSSGEVRRSVSDIFFAEVRPFEEIYRQGEQQPQGQQQNQQSQQQQQGGNQQTEELLELQKQIVAGTWNVLRKAGSRESMPGKLGPDILVLQESQQSAIQLLEQKAQEQTAEGAAALLDSAREAMTQAAVTLGLASSGLAPNDLKEALSFEQIAYQALLKLQAKEFEISRQQQQQGQPSSSRQQSRQQQIDQLQLEQDENRYEEERVAQEQDSAAQQELRQVISRLRELAARQEDLNEQLRELEAALQLAKSEEERKELEDQLERLREQQQQLLQDTDETQERMQSSESQELQEAQEQLDQARENIQQSNEALQKGDTSKALASGTRAQEKLEELQEEVRKQAANQFEQTMRNMQSQAQELESTQEEILKQLTESDEPSGAGLREEKSPADDVTDRIEEQSERLANLLEQMQETVVDAEEAEPLLAQKLYDTFRTTQQERAEERMDVTERLLQRNLKSDAIELAEESRQDLSNLREGIEEAAEAVLGSEVESLQRALNQLEDLTSDLDQEIEDATGISREESQRDSGSTEDPSQANSDAEPGEGAPRRQSGNESDRDGQPRDTLENSNEGGSSRGSRESEQDEESLSSNRNQEENQERQERPEQQESASNGQPPNRQQQNEQAQGRGQGSQSGEEQQDSNANQSDQDSPESSQPSQSPQGRPSTDSQRPGLRGAREDTQSSPQTRTGGGNPRPLTGENFQQWSDQLRDVEELVTDEELRWQATQIRQTAREVRRQLKQHAADPKWSEVEDLIASPLRDLQRRVRDEILRRAAKKTEIVPIDSDPVPANFSRSVQQYYENLGASSK